MKNRRSHNTIHKKYRRYRSDIWGKLAIKRRNNFITKLIYDFGNIALRRQMRRLTPKQKTNTKRFFGNTLQKNPNRLFCYQINIPSVQRRIRPNSQRGIL